MKHEISTKNLSLKVLNELKSVDVPLVTKVAPRETFAQIPEGCMQRFGLADNFALGAATMAVRGLNEHAGRKAYVLVSENNQTVVAVYHISAETYAYAEREKRREKEEKLRARAKARQIEREFTERRRQEQKLEREKAERRKAEREARKASKSINN